MEKVVYLVHLNHEAAFRRTKKGPNRYPAEEFQLQFAFSSKASAEDFCRGQTSVVGIDPLEDGPWRFQSVDPDTRLARFAWIEKVPLDPTPTLPGMEGI